MTDNHDGECMHCETDCVRCGGQHHRETSTHHYQEAIIKVPRSDIERLLSLSVCDEVRAMAARWLNGQND